MLLRHGLTRFLFIAAYCSISDARAATYLVRPDGSGDYPTISSAVAAAQNEDEIVLGDGIFKGQANRNVFVYEKTLTIRSESGDPSRCTIDCEQVLGGQDEENYAFYFRRADHVPGTPVLEGITFTRGWSELGGALRFWVSSPRIRNCVFVENSALEGGAILCVGDLANQSYLVLENCVIVNNVSSNYPGGGIFCGWYVHTTITGCTIANNAVWNDREGGGIAVWDYSTLTIRNSIIAGQWMGEGLYCNETASATLSCTNVFGNAGGDWVGCIADQLEMNGNFSLDPLFCGPEKGNFLLREDSPCAPPGITDCGLLGALPVGCDTVSISPRSWGKIKSAYRE